jgi:hypothetical protein
MPDLTKFTKAKYTYTWLPNIQALAGTSNRRQTHIFGQGLPFKVGTKMIALYWHF